MHNPSRRTGQTQPKVAEMKLLVSSVMTEKNGGSAYSFASNTLDINSPVLSDSKVEDILKWLRDYHKVEHAVIIAITKLDE